MRRACRAVPAGDAHALHQRRAALVLGAGAIPTCAAIDEARHLLLVGTRKARGVADTVIHG